MLVEKIKISATPVLASTVNCMLRRVDFECYFFFSSNIYHSAGGFCLLIIHLPGEPFLQMHVNIGACCWERVKVMKDAIFAGRGTQGKGK